MTAARSEKLGGSLDGVGRLGRTARGEGMDKMEMKEMMQVQNLKKEENLKREEILCNCCGRPLRSRNGLLMEDAFKAVKEWGYFSKKDLQVHSFTLCEECYDKITSLFQIPVTVSQKREVM